MPEDLTTLLALGLIPGTSQRKAREMAREGQVPHSLAFAAAHEQASRLLEEHWREGIEVVGIFDGRYPARLGGSPSPPNALYVRGDVAALSKEGLVAVVGTRHPTSFGATAADAISRALAEAGLGTVSGLALGVDSICHQAALDAGGVTIAVLGSGLDCITPAQNHMLAELVAEHGGALVSEHPLGVKTRPQQLVARNRIQVGLSCLAVICQTAHESGTMHTARFAVEASVPIWCPRPQAPSEASAGNVALLDLPGRELPGTLPAFTSTSARWQEKHLGDEPVAHEITREGLAGLIEALKPA
jgi:DNA processing protein